MTITLRIVTGVSKCRVLKPPLVRVRFVILTWRSGTRRLKAIAVSRVTVPRASMRLGIGTSHFAFAIVGCAAWTIVSVIARNEKFQLDWRNSPDYHNLRGKYTPFLHLSRIHGRRRAGETLPSHDDFSSTRDVGEAIRPAASRGEIAASLKLFLQSHLLGGSGTMLCYYHGYM